jgi:hypothetical protein
LDLGSLEGWKACAVDIMRRPSNVRSVELVVEQLMQYGEVGVDVVKACIATADSASAS